MPSDSPPPAPDEPSRTESAWLVASFRGGDEAAATALFERYFARLAALVRGRLGAKLRARVDADDVAMSAYRSFFVRAAAGQFELEESGDLWRLLARMALHKLSHQVERHTAEKRAVSHEERLTDSNGLTRDIASLEPSPEEAAAVADELEFIMRSLNETERRTLELRLQGELLEAIAAELGQSERTVRRTLAHVREIMLKRLPDAERSAPAAISVTETGEPGGVSPRTLCRDTQVRGLTPPGSPRPDGIAGETPLLDHTDFLLQRHIGAGLTGKVYRAWWKSRECNVAVKYLRRAHLKHPERIARFCEEAALVADLKHPNIVAMQGLGRAPHGGFFIVFDWIDGPNLQTLIELAHSDRGPLAVQDITRWMADAARAVEYAHQRGIVHCDLKPSNLLLAPDGRVVLTDFGFARRLTTDAGSLIAGGTLAFMAPEQLDPSFGEIGPHTDVYGWGTVLYSLLTGEPPHRERRPADLMAALLSGRKLRSVREIRRNIPDRLAALCQACLNVDPFTRPTSLCNVTAEWDAAFGFDHSFCES